MSKYCIVPTKPRIFLVVVCAFVDATFPETSMNSRRFVCFLHVCRPQLLGDERYQIVAITTQPQGTAAGLFGNPSRKFQSLLHLSFLQLNLVGEGASPNGDLRIEVSQSLEIRNVDLTISSSLFTPLPGYERS